VHALSAAKKHSWGETGMTKTGKSDFLDNPDEDGTNPNLNCYNESKMMSIIFQDIFGEIISFIIIIGIIIFSFMLNISKVHSKGLF
jgi:hypothetical protein